MIDLKIANGVIVDGTGKDSFKGDIGIDDGKILTIGNLENIDARDVINAEGLCVCPGFIDVHSHSDLRLFSNNLFEEKIQQGITTVLIGNCGLSVVPQTERYKEELERYLVPLLGNAKICLWRSFSDYFNWIEEKGININVGAFVGHGTIRIATMGFANNPLTKAKLSKMKRFLVDALEQGVLGMSTGLIYSPGSFATFDELKELCKVLSKYKGVYTSHIRNESNYVLESVNETIELGRATGVKVNISHLKVSAPVNWGKTTELLYLLTSARVNGINVTCDTYPYKAGSSMAYVLLPPWFFEQYLDVLEEGLGNQNVRQQLKRDFRNGRHDWQCQVNDIGWDNILIASVNTEKNCKYEGMTFAEAAVIEGKEPDDFFLDLIMEEKGNIVIIVNQEMEEDVRRIISYPYCMFGTDDVYAKKPHPRNYGTFPRVLGKYVRKEKVLSLEEAIRKMTSLPVRTYNLGNIGQIKRGYNADIVVFDPKEIIDLNSYQNPFRQPAGIKNVIINGKIVFDSGIVKRVLSGRVIRRQV